MLKGISTEGFANTAMTALKMAATNGAVIDQTKETDLGRMNKEIQSAMEPRRSTREIIAARGVNMLA